MKTKINCIEKLSDLKTIIHCFETAAHPQVVMHTANKAYYNCHQYQWKSNSDYFSRLNSTIDAVTKQQGSLGDDWCLVEEILIAFVNCTNTTLATVNSQEYKDTCKAVENDAATYLLLGTGKGRYLNLHAKLKRDYALGNNLHPNKRSETLRALD